MVSVGFGSAAALQHGKVGRSVAVSFAIRAECVRALTNRPHLMLSHVERVKWNKREEGKKKDIKQNPLHSSDTRNKRFH